MDDERLQRIREYVATDVAATYAFYRYLYGTHNPELIRKEVDAIAWRKKMHIPEHDPFNDGTAVRYTRELSGKSYTYVALRAAGQWYTTAIGVTSAMTWQEFSDLLFSERTSNVEVAGIWVPWDDAVAAVAKLYPTMEIQGETQEDRTETQRYATIDEQTLYEMSLNAEQEPPF